MFQNLRYFCGLFLLAVVVLVATFIVYAKYTGTRAIIRKSAAQHAELTEQYFQERIWDRYFPIVNFVNSTREENISTIPAYILLKEEMEDLFKRDEILDAVLMDNDKIIYELIKGHKIKDLMAIEPESKIVKNKIPGKGTFFAYQAYYVPNLIKLPESYNQFASDLDAKLLVIYDINKQMRKLNNIIWLGSFIFVMLSFGIVIYIYLMSIRTEKLLEKGGVSNLKGEGDLEITDYEDKAEFYDNINHELRTPLNAIIGFSELMKNESMGPLENKQYKEFVQTIYEAGAQLLMLIDDIQDYAKAGENKLAIENELMDFNKMTRLCMQMVDTSATDKGVDLQDELGEERYVINADPRRMKQVILNILTNAIKFTDKGGLIMLILKPNEEKITLEIKDNGKGMSPDDLENALIPFGGAKEEQDGTKVKKQTSTGLGLPLTKKLIELMGGEFDITSEINLGTKVRLTFKINSGDATHVERTLVEQENDKTIDAEKLEQAVENPSSVTTTDKHVNAPESKKQVEQVEGDDNKAGDTEGANDEADEKITPKPKANKPKGGLDLTDNVKDD